MSDRAYMPQSLRQDYETPDWLFDLLDDEFQFTIDGAASSYNTKHERYWTKEDNALAQDWTDETVWINPPFENKRANRTLSKFVEKAWNETRSVSVKVVMLVPVKSDQRWWHEWAKRCEIRFIKGRIKFDGEEHTHTGPLAVLIFGRDVRPKIGPSIRVPRKR
jgi:site-specific DNA-methyltransferase (adenine-specific)